MKKQIQKIIGFIMILISMLAALYIGLSVYYAEGFSYGTWVNAVYCTGKTVSQVNEELIATDAYDKMVLVLPDGTQETLFLKKIAYRPDFSKELMEIRSQQNPWKWYQNLSTSARERKIVPMSQMDEECLEKMLSEMEFLKDRKTDAEYKVYIQKTEAGYELVNERLQVPDYEACIKAVKEAIYCREERLDLLEAGCYRDLPLDNNMLELIVFWEQLDAFQNSGVAYQFGEETEQVDAAIVCEWLVASEGLVQTEVITSDTTFQRDETGRFLVNREKIEEYIDTLAEHYDTLGSSRQFQTTGGRVVEVCGGTYGNRIDRETEKEYLYQTFAKQEYISKKPHPRIPVYLQEAWKKGRDDIGDTYIEVDMGEQHLYYYKNGELALDAPIVTGDMRRKRSTPSMVCYVYAKQKNRVLRGPGYASPVKYWMPVKGGIGIHDARWRKEFGGEIYQTDGSHGCINMPLEVAQQLYEQVEIGTPVIMFY